MFIAIICAVTVLWPALMELADCRWDGRRWSWRNLIEKLVISVAAALYAIGLLSIFRGIKPLQTIEQYPVIIIVTVIAAGLIWLMISGHRRKKSSTAETDSSTENEPAESEPAQPLRTQQNFLQLKPLLLIVLLAVVLETTLFNFRFFESLTFQPAESFQVSYSESIKTQNGISKVDKSIGQPEIYLSDINQVIENIYIDIDPVNGKFANGEDDTLLASHVVKLTLSATDEANVNAISLPEISIADQVEGTKYIKLSLSGQVSTLTIRLNNLNDRDFKIRSIILNRRVPYELSLWRLLGLIVILLIIWLIRPGSDLYKIDLNLRQRWQGNTVIITTIVLILILVLMASANPFCNGTVYTGHRTQYEVFSEMLAKGQLYFDYEVDPKLAALENPYDPGARRDAGAAYKWDHAYYNGKYYMYFGIVPELLTFLPFRLLTGQSLPTFMAINIFLILLAIGIMLLLHQMIKIWFQRTGFLIYLLLAILFILSSGLIIAKYPSVYLVPISASVVLGVWGLYLWIRAKSMVSDHPVRMKINLAAGSLCIALIFGCRPQVGLIFLAALPLFWSETIHRRLFFSKKGLLNTFLLILPFVIVAAGLMWYNAARFGSPLEFGAQYNITTNDMTRRGFVFDRIPTGLFTYFIQLPVIGPQFPFYNPIRFYTRYQGITINETTFGSVFLTWPMLSAVFLAKYVRQTLREKKLLGFFVLLPLIAVIIAVADIQVAGILQRYIADFSWLLFIAAALVILSFSENRPDPGQSPWFYRFFSTVCVLSLAFAALYFFLNEASSYSAEYSMAVLYHRVSDLVEFWR